MIPFAFNENRFSFFFAYHLLVGQLCTNPKSDRSLLSCLKVTQCSTSEIGDAPRYNWCSLPIQVMTTGPLPAPSKCRSGRFNAWGHSSTHRTTLLMATVMVFSVVSSEDHIMPLHIFEVELKSVVIPWCNQVVGPQVQWDPGLSSEGVLRLCTLLSLAPLLPWPEPAGLLCLVIRREHHQHDLPQHQSQPVRRHPPSSHYPCKNIYFYKDNSKS